VDGCTQKEKQTLKIGSFESVIETLPTAFSNYGKLGLRMIGMLAYDGAPPLIGVPLSLDSRFQRAVVRATQRLAESWSPSSRWPRCCKR
jgi:hypothetical protein